MARCIINCRQKLSDKLALVQNVMAFLLAWCLKLSTHVARREVMGSQEHGSGDSHTRGVCV
jgi:hypothetical protein